MSFLFQQGLLFQSTLPRGERLQDIKKDIKAEEFQSTLPRGERPPFVILLISLSAFQSTLPRGERLHLEKLVVLLRYFNPRSREGSDECCVYFVIVLLLFQSTLPRGERLILILILYPIVTISIHAPARGATHHVIYDFHRHTYFNPRSREGSDRYTCTGKVCVLSFQSTLPRGERLK